MSLSPYEMEQKEIEEKIWSFLDVEDLTVIDFGVGQYAESTQKLVDMGATVIGVDNDADALTKYKDLSAHLIQCDIRNLPFRPHTADAAVFHFILHEIDPALHEDIISEVASIVGQVMIVEPTPGTSPAYKRYGELWRDAMHAVGKFEDYRPPSYWETLIQTNLFNVVLSQTIEHKENIPLEIIERIVHFTLENWKEEGVPPQYNDRMKNFLEYAKEEGMKWSDVAVIIGESKVWNNK